MSMQYDLAITDNMHLVSIRHFFQLLFCQIHKKHILLSVFTRFFDALEQSFKIIVRILKYIQTNETH